MSWRWRLAYLLNRSRRWCWYRLVAWVMYRGPVRDLANAHNVTACHVRVGSCYCGKFRNP